MRQRKLNQKIKSQSKKDPAPQKLFEESEVAFRLRTQGDKPQSAQAEYKKKDFKLLDDYQQSFFVLKRFKIKHESLVNIYSSIYINIFDNNKYIFHFINVL